MTLLPPPKFDVDLGGGRSAVKRWHDWLCRFDYYMTAGGICGELKQIATLLHVAGEQIEQFTWLNG